MLGRYKFAVVRITNVASEMSGVLRSRSEHGAYTGWRCPADLAIWGTPVWQSTVSV
jgi:hypothetical protein